MCVTVRVDETSLLFFSPISPLPLLLLSLSPAKRTITPAKPSFSFSCFCIDAHSKIRPSRRREKRTLLFSQRQKKITPVLPSLQSATQTFQLLLTTGRTFLHLVWRHQSKTFELQIQGKSNQKEKSS